MPHEPKVPYVTLRAYLGPAAEARSARQIDERKVNVRVWPCGCSCTYYDSPHHTARWAPCPRHAVAPTSAPAASAAPQTGAPAGEAPTDHLSPVQRRRIPPRFFILDRDRRVTAMSDGLDMPEMVQLAMRLLPKGALTSALVPFAPQRFLRIVELRGLAPGSVAVFFEDVSERGSVEAAARRYGLTRREVDVLRLIARHRSNSEIARALSIAESTVGDHLKSLFRKTGSNRRTELLLKLFDDGGEDAS